MKRSLPKSNVTTDEDYREYEAGGRRLWESYYPSEWDFWKREAKRIRKAGKGAKVMSADDFHWRHLIDMVRLLYGLPPTITETELACFIADQHGGVYPEYYLPKGRVEAWKREMNKPYRSGLIPVKFVGGKPVFNVKSQWYTKGRVSSSPAVVNPKMKKPEFQCHNKPDVLLYIAGTDGSSTNGKTGALQQLSFLVDGVEPLNALRTKCDEAVCGHCPLRPMSVDAEGRTKKRACYVNVSKAVTTQYLTVCRGRQHHCYGEPNPNLPIRLGTYGDPAVIPIKLLKKIADRHLAVGLTGYTHQWRWCDPEYSRYCMASCEWWEVPEAHEKGYRCFVVYPEGTAPDYEHRKARYAAINRQIIQCPATVNHPRFVQAMIERGRDRHGLIDRYDFDCAHCLICNGTSGAYREQTMDVWIETHGIGYRQALGAERRLKEVGTSTDILTAALPPGYEYLVPRKQLKEQRARPPFKRKDLREMEAAGIDWRSRL